MQTEETKKLFTVDEYYKMVDAGILHDGDRTELIEGEIIEMSPMGSRHAAQGKLRAKQGKIATHRNIPVRPTLSSLWRSRTLR